MMDRTGERRRAALRALLAGLAAPAFGVRAGDYPERPLRLIVPYAAGGGPDIQTRLLGAALARRLGQPVVVENRVGAGGILAAEYLAQQAPDGYTLMMGASTHVTQKLLQPSVRFDPLRFAHVIRVSTSAEVLLVGAGAPYRGVADLVAAARQAPGRLNYASGGIGSAAHLAGAAFSAAAGIETLHIPYRGSVEIVPSLIKGDTQFGFPVASTALPQLRNGKVRALAVMAARRDPALPQVPTVNEALGRTDLALESWSGLWGPPGLPPAVMARLQQAVMAALSDDTLRLAFARDGAVPSPTASPAEFQRFVASETERYRSIIARNHITLQ